LIPAYTNVAGRCGEVFEVIGHVLTGAGGQVQVVDLIHQHQLITGFDEDLADSVGDIGGVPAGLDRRQVTSNTSASAAGI
jgi:hypothetical protein